MAEHEDYLPSEKDVESYELLMGMLHSQQKEFAILSSKKADTNLNKIKIKMVNRVLEPLKEIFKEEEVYKFLDVLNEDDMPSNSDVVLVFSQYAAAIKDFKDKYYCRDKYSGRYRWMTKECPPEYYKDEEECDEEENEDEYDDEGENEDET